MKPDEPTWDWGECSWTTQTNSCVLRVLLQTAHTVTTTVLCPHSVDCRNCTLQYEYILMHTPCVPYQQLQWSSRGKSFCDYVWGLSFSASLVRFCSRELWKASSHDSGIRNSSSRSQIQKIRCLQMITQMTPTAVNTDA